MPTCTHPVLLALTPRAEKGLGALPRTCPKWPGTVVAGRERPPSMANQRSFVPRVRHESGHWHDLSGDGPNDGFASSVSGTPALLGPRRCSCVSRLPAPSVAPSAGDLLPVAPGLTTVASQCKLCREGRRAIHHPLTARVNRLRRGPPPRPSNYRLRDRPFSMARGRGICRQSRQRRSRIELREEHHSHLRRKLAWTYKYSRIKIYE